MSMIGKTLAHYEITSQLGKGGMGEVLDFGLAKACSTSAKMGDGQLCF